jgi:hypothetical protein
MENLEKAKNYLHCLSSPTSICPPAILKPGIKYLDYNEKVGDEATVIFQKIGLLKKSD